MQRLTSVADEHLRLMVPVYLNQRVVFDLLAMLQDGIATVTKVSASEEKGKQAATEAGATFGLSKALSSLLRINLSGKHARGSNEKTGESRDEERVHTPPSLFYKLRNLLHEKKLIIGDNANVMFEPGQFVEFQTTLKRNPIVEVMDVMCDLMSMADAFTDHNPQAQSNKGKQSGSTKTDHKKIKTQIQSFADKLKAGNTIDLTTENLKSGYKALLTAEIEYLNDPSMSDLVDGTFAVVGKVTRAVAGGQGTVSLIRKTVFSRLAPQLLQEMFSHLKAMETQQQFKLPELIWEIEGPVIQVLPIAIFA
jgi:hypothetical protein